MSDRKGKTRNEAVYVDKFGRQVGRDSGGGGSSTNRESSTSRREPQDVPRSERADAPRRSSTVTTMPYNASSLRYSTRDRPRRESESLGTRQHLRADHEVSAESSGGYTGRSSRVDGGDDVNTSQLQDPMARMTVNEDLGSPQYTYESSSRAVPPTDKYRSDSSPAQIPPLSSFYHDLRAGSRLDKGKGIARDLSPAPALPVISKHLVKGTHGETEKLDEKYVKRSSDYKKFFRPGRVFSTLWTESYDDSMQSEKDQWSEASYEVAYQERAYCKIRRFVVVKKDDRSCTCLPVATYDGKGYKKRGINLNHHGLIFSSRDLPDYVNGITKEPLKVILSKGAEKLVNPSYLNYGRVYTVECNVKVRDVGELDARSKELLRSYYRSVQLDDLLDDEGTGPGLTSNPQLRAVEITGVGTSFANNMPNSGYDGRGAYDRPSGGYNGRYGWNRSGGAPPPAYNPYVAQPQYPNHAGPGLPSVASTYQYADVSQPRYQQQDHRSHNPSATHGIPQHNYRALHNPYIPDPYATGGFANSHSTPRYSSGIDLRWSRGPLYSSSTAPVVSSGMHPSRNQGYSTTSDPRHINPTPAPASYYESHATDGRPGQYSPPVPPASQANLDQDENHEILLPTEQEAQREQDGRRERRDNDRERDRDRGRSRR